MLGGYFRSGTKPLPIIKGSIKLYPLFTDFQNHQTCFMTVVLIKSKPLSNNLLENRRLFANSSMKTARLFEFQKNKENWSFFYCKTSQNLGTRGFFCFLFVGYVCRIDTMHQLLYFKSKFPNHFAFTFGRYLFLLFWI